MDTSSSIPNVPKPSPAVSHKELPSSKKEIDGKTVTDVQEQPSNCLYGLAIFVGSVALVVLCTFGTVGLLKSYQVITLNHYFEWLSIAIDFVGNTPYYVSLWGITAAGVVVGGGLIIFGACKVHPTTQENETKKIAEEPIESFFSADMMTTNGFQAGRFDNLARGTFTIERKVIRNGKNSVPSEDGLCAVVFRDKEGMLQSSEWVTKPKAIELAIGLKDKKDFDPANAATAFHVLFKAELPQGINKTEYIHPTDINRFCIHSRVSADGEETNLFIVKASEKSEYMYAVLPKAKGNMLKPLLEEAFRSKK